jgi:hypothetical protein
LPDELSPIFVNRSVGKLLKPVLGWADLAPRDRTRTGRNKATVLISLFVEAVAQGAIFSPTSVFSQTSLLHVAQGVFYDIDVASKFYISPENNPKKTYNLLVMLLYGLI